jgi:hypothetical protein
LVSRLFLTNAMAGVMLDYADLPAGLAGLQIFFCDKSVGSKRITERIVFLWKFFCIQLEMDSLRKIILVTTLLFGLAVVPGFAQQHHNNSRDSAYYNGMRSGGRGGNYYNSHDRPYHDDHRRDNGIGPGKGALIGAAGGAALGAVFGGGLKGTIVGGAAGAGIGAVVGQAAQNNRQNQYRHPY